MNREGIATSNLESSIRVVLVRTDASCVRPMGYFTIFFCVLCVRFCPSEGRKYDAKAGFCVLLASFDFCVGILIVNSVDLFLEPKKGFYRPASTQKYIVTIPSTPSSPSAAIPCLHEPPPAAAAASTRIPRPAPPSPPSLHLPIVRIRREQ